MFVLCLFVCLYVCLFVFNHGMFSFIFLQVSTCGSVEHNPLQFFVVPTSVLVITTFSSHYPRPWLVDVYVSPTW